MKIATAVKTSLAVTVLASSLAMPASAAHGDIDYVFNYYTQGEFNPFEPGYYTGKRVFYCDGHYQLIGRPDMVEVYEDVTDC